MEVSRVVMSENGKVKSGRTGLRLISPRQSSDQGHLARQEVTLMPVKSLAAKVFCHKLSILHGQPIYERTFYSYSTANVSKGDRLVRRNELYGVFNMLERRSTDARIKT